MLTSSQTTSEHRCSGSSLRVNGVLSLLQESNPSEIDPKLLELVNANDDHPYNSNVGSPGNKTKKQGSGKRK